MNGLFTFRICLQVSGSLGRDSSNMLELENDEKKRNVKGFLLLPLDGQNAFYPILNLYIFGAYFICVL